MKKLLGAGAGLILLSLSLALETHNMPVLASERCIVGRMVKSEAKEPERGQIRCERFIISGMPCERYEQETSEETELVPQWSEGECAVGQGCEAVMGQGIQAEAHSEPETHTACGQVPVPQETQTVERVDTAETLADDEPACVHDDGLLLTDYLRSLLESYGIGWWYPYAYAQVMQESHWNPYAENVNGLDKGLLQYRITFYPGANIFDPYEQIRIYVGQVANRLNAGLSVEETISRHITSDWVTDINWQYVQDVLRWMQ